MNDSYNLPRFIEAQKNSYSIALSEIKNGKKQSHWMWYIFPQLAGLGLTSISIKYSIKNLHEAKAYLENEILRNRLIEISKVLLTHKINDAHKIFGSPDDLKLRSCMTLFSLVPDADDVFQLVLNKFFHGKKDEKTLQLLGL